MYINQTLTYNIQGDRIYYEGSGPQSLKVVKHSVKPFPQNRSFPSHQNPIDITAYVSNLHELKLTWTTNKNADGVREFII